MVIVVVVVKTMVLVNCSNGNGLVVVKQNFGLFYFYCLEGRVLFVSPYRSTLPTV